MPNKCYRFLRFYFVAHFEKQLPLLLFFALVSCHTADNKTTSVKNTIETEFPEALKYELSDEAEAFHSLPPDSSKIDFLFYLAERQPVFRSVIYKSIISQTNDSVQYKKHIYAYRLLSRTFTKSNLIDSVAYYCREGIKCCNNDPKYNDQLSEFYRDLGNLYANFSRNAEAIANFDKAIQIASKAGNKEKLFRYITETGRIYLGMNEIEKAKECYQKGRLYAEQYHDSSLMVYSLNSLGDICRREKKFVEAIEYHQLANKVNQQRFKTPYEQWACASIGKNYSNLKQYDSARKYFNISLKLATRQGSFDLETQAYLNLSICDFNEKKIDRAIHFGQLAYQSSERIPSLEVKVGVAENLYKLYKETDQYQKAIVHLERMHILQDSLENNENTRKFAETEFKLKEDKLLQKIDQDQKQFRLEQEKRQQEAKTKNIIILSVTFISILSIVFGFYVFRSFRQIRAKNRIIEEKQREILESIKYARKIQNSLLPTEKYIERILKKINPDRH